jgi:tRNA pseudouridine55 synthase
MASSGAEGILVVDKPQGLTSHDVVARLRRVLGTRKVGHGGTLDPMATGVLVCGAGRATKLLGIVAVADKEYLATVRLGIATLSDDAMGEVISNVGAQIEGDVIDLTLDAQRGVIGQRPSSVSAIKVDGKRAYDLVRQGEEVELPSREVTISKLVVETVRHEVLDGLPVTDIDIRVVCSSGTYVRAIARDLGEALGVGGHLTMLRRTRVGRYGLDRSQTLGELMADEPSPPNLISMLDIARDEFAVLELTEAESVDVAHGARIAVPERASDLTGLVAVLDFRGQLLAVSDVIDSRLVHRMVLADDSGRL